MPHPEYEDLIPVEGHQNLYRDRNNESIVNTDKNNYDNYMKVKRLKQNEKEELDTIKSDIEEIKSLLREALMDPDQIELKNLSKSFAYQKIANELDNCDSVSVMRDIAKSYAKLYLKQQEVVAGLGLEGI